MRFFDSMGGVTTCASFKKLKPCIGEYADKSPHKMPLGRNTRTNDVCSASDPSTSPPRRPSASGSSPLESLRPLNGKSNSGRRFSPIATDAKKISLDPCESASYFSCTRSGDASESYQPIGAGSRHSPQATPAPHSSMAATTYSPTIALFSI